jgi:dipeptidyl aminopeptidase/acylaminoacyl peptidase
MSTAPLHLNARRVSSVVVLLALLLIETAPSNPPIAPVVTGEARTALAHLPTVERPRTRRIAPPQVLTIEYTAHNGNSREATVLLPASYRPGNNPPLPLIISPHGRGATGASNAKFFGSMPTRGNFAVVSPDGMGRASKGFSYGYAGQIDDLARMPQILTDALPWVRIDRERIYALGSSMGGQETLLLVARHPRLLAGAAAMDSVTDLDRRYDQLLELRSTPKFAKRWGAPVGVCLQSSMRREVGAAPETAPGLYAARSPLAQARAIAGSGVPLQIWWSHEDAIVIDQEHQSQALFDEMRRIGTEAPLIAYSGSWEHSKEMRAHALLPLALQDFGLLPRGFKSVPTSVRRVEVAS